MRLTAGALPLWAKDQSMQPVAVQAIEITLEKTNWVDMIWITMWDGQQTEKGVVAQKLKGLINSGTLKKCSVFLVYDFAYGEAGYVSLKDIDVVGAQPCPAGILGPNSYEVTGRTPQIIPGVNVPCCPGPFYTPPRAYATSSSLISGTNLNVDDSEGCDTRGKTKEIILSSGAISEMLGGDEELVPIVQIIDTFEDEDDNYRLLLSDGVHVHQAILSPKMHNLIGVFEHKRGCIVKLIEYFCFKINEQKNLMLIDLDILEEGYEIIGRPKPYIEANVGDPTTSKTGAYAAILTAKAPENPQANSSTVDVPVPSKKDASTQTEGDFDASTQTAPDDPSSPKKKDPKPMEPNPAVVAGTSTAEKIPEPPVPYCGFIANNYGTSPFSPFYWLDGIHMELGDIHMELGNIKKDLAKMKEKDMPKLKQEFETRMDFLEYDLNNQWMQIQDQTQMMQKEVDDNLRKI